MHSTASNQNLLEFETSKAVFLNPGPVCPPTLHILCLPNQTHLIQLRSSLEETPGPEIGVSGKGDIQNVQCWGRPGPGLRNIDLKYLKRENINA